MAALGAQLMWTDPAHHGQAEAGKYWVALAGAHACVLVQMLMLVKMLCLQDCGC